MAIVESPANQIVRGRLGSSNATVSSPSWVVTTSLLGSDAVDDADSAEPLEASVSGSSDVIEFASVDVLVGALVAVPVAVLVVGKVAGAEEPDEGAVGWETVSPTGVDDDGSGSNVVVELAWVAVPPSLVSVEAQAIAKPARTPTHGALRVCMAPYMQRF